MAKRPRNKKVDRSIIDQGGVTPIRALTVALLNRKERKEDEEYQDALKEMGMLDNAGGRGGGVRGGMAPKKMKSGGKTADGIAIKGKTRLAMKGYGKVG
jgi:hypothetical protein